MVIIPDKGVGELSLNGSWEFMGEEPGCCVQIPGDLYAMGIHTVTDQIYEYRRLVHVPEEFMGKRIFLELSAIHDDTQILVDKETAAVNQIPYMDCHIDLTKQLKPGKTAENQRESVWMYGFSLTKTRREPIMWICGKNWQRKRDMILI